MKILLGYSIILGFLISFCNCYNFSVAVDPYHKEIYRFVKKVITDWNQKHENDINDISIINMDNDTSLFHIVRKAIPKQNPIFLPDCGGREYLKHVNTRRSSIFIIISRIFGNIVSFYKFCSRYLWLSPGLGFSVYICTYLTPGVYH